MIQKNQRSVAFSGNYTAKKIFFPLLLLALSNVFFLGNAFCGDKHIESGLSVQYFPIEKENDALTVLRIDPQEFTIVLLSAKEENVDAKDLRTWSKEHTLHAAINASMYLKDGKTSTGYMRRGKMINNPRISQKFGAFFVANPDTATLPAVDILERDAENLTETLRHYEIVVQNYRLIGRDKKNLWPKTGKKHAIAAIGIDNNGFILFIFCRSPMIPHDFALTLLSLPLDIRSAMYVEGGSEAGLLFLEDDALRTNTLIPFFEPIIPNVLGIRKKDK